MINPLALSFFVLLGLSFVAEALLNRGSVSGQAIGGAGGTFTTDILTSDRSLLTIMTDMTGAAAGDLGVIVTPFEIDNATLMGINLSPDDFDGPVFGGGRITQHQRFSVGGFDKVRVTITNNNVGAQTITRFSWRLSG